MDNKCKRYYLVNLYIEVNAQFTSCTYCITLKKCCTNYLGLQNFTTRLFLQSWTLN